MRSYLHRDLVEEILSRVPATSLKRLRSTCKRWNTLFKKPRFTQRHFHKAPKESMVLMLKEQRVCPVSVNLNVAPPSIEFQGGLKDSDSNLGQAKKISEVFHCDGLLLCTYDDNRFMVWNPCLGETRWMQRKTGDEKHARFALGYENNQSCRRSYKILRCWGHSYDYKIKKRPLGFEVYDFSSDSWKVLDDVAHDHFPAANGVSLKGNTFWVGFDIKQKTSFLLSFDYTTERFKNQCLPGFQNHHHRCTALSLVGEEQLLVLQRIQSKMEIYVTKKVDTEAGLLWSKSFTVDLPIDSSCTQIFASLLIDEEKKVALCCTRGLKTAGNIVFTIGEDKEYYYSETPYTESTNKPWWVDGTHSSSNKPLWFPFIFSYVPSLVQI